MPYDPIDLSARLTEKHESGKNFLHGANERSWSWGEAFKHNISRLIQGQPSDLIAFQMLI